MRKSEEAGVVEQLDVGHDDAIRATRRVFDRIERLAGQKQAAQARQVVLPADLLGQAHESAEVGRNPLARGDLVAVDEGQGLLRVELLHQADGRAEPHLDLRELQRGRVVERARTEVGVLLVEAEDHREAEGARDDRAGSGGLEQDLRPHALGAPGGTRRIDHRAAFALVGDPGRRKRADNLLVGLEALDFTAHGEAAFDLRKLLGEALDDVADASAREEHLRVAIVHDVLHLLGGEVPVYRREVETRADRAPEELEEALLVSHDRSDRIAGPQAPGPQRLRNAVRALVEFAVGEPGTGIAKDQGGLVGMVLCTGSDVHAASLDGAGERAGASRSTTRAKV